MTPAILGLGVALPPRSIEQAQAAEDSAKLGAAHGVDPDRLASLYAKTGVRRRGSVLLDEAGAVAHFLPAASSARDRGPGTAERLERFALDAPPIAARAARSAMADARVTPAQIDHLITVSCTGAGAPGVDIALVGALGLRPGVSRTHVGFMGCHGALNGLRVAAALAGQLGSQGINPAPARHGTMPRALLVAVELCTLHYHYSNAADRHIANALFADAAAAAVVGVAGSVGAADERGAGVLDADLYLHAATPLPILDAATILIPDSLGAMTWTVGNHGFEMTLSPRVPELIGRHLREFISGWLALRGLSIADVSHWAIHPGGPRILRAAASTLELSAAAAAPSADVLAEHGNMSSPTVLVILEKLRRAGVRGPTVMMGFGPGLVVEAALIGAPSSQRP